ncbi:MAG: 2-oxoacid:acceptor oxidoreductase family protein [Desulfovibrio sp.]|jgi:2-oxoglutarate ferredoxin oxidoreductase subunit gamma|nr:2-oxoacid:acceptor oxidoreductase family protein [Desulfovibrio sp.]
MPEYQDVIIAGFGGQGVMIIGNLLAQAGLEQGFEVSFIPVYGAEMRGGTANCTVVLDTRPIGSPIVREPLSTIVLNEPSLTKFQPCLDKKGVQIVNASLIDKSLVSREVNSVYIPANDIAHRLGNVRLASMVALGAWLQATDALPLKAVQEALNRVVSAHYAKLIPVNSSALEAGWNFA